MNRILGIDTSNYTTSAALFFDGQMFQQKQLLPVKEGQLGLRQSDAVFHHVQQLPDVLEPLLSSGPGLSAIGVSSRPRDLEGSYMPCFTVGYGTAKALSDAFQIPLFCFSHQAGHIAAALYGAGCLELLERPFFAYHVSGGTTEAVLVTPDPERIFTCKIVASSLDLKGGQAVDRVGGMLGLPFPAGRELETLALRWDKPCKVRPSMKGADFCLSGIENQCRKLYEQKCSPEEIARYCLELLLVSLDQSCGKLLEDYGQLPVVFAGGVMSNSIIRDALTEKYGAYFAPPKFSADNAVGIAILAALQEGGL